MADFPEHCQSAELTKAILGIYEEVYIGIIWGVGIYCVCVWSLSGGSVPSLGGLLLEVVSLANPSLGMLSSRKHLVGNVANMSPCVIAMPIMSAENEPTSPCCHVIFGFGVESHVRLDIYIAFFT